MSNAFNILAVKSSARNESVTNTLVDEAVARLQAAHPDARLVTHNVGHDGAPFVDDTWVMLRSLDQSTLSSSQKAVMNTSDALIEDVIAADALVIGAPIYNFGIPASLKAWIDLVARAGKTFRPKEGGGYEGLSNVAKAYVVLGSAGVPAGSPVDFATPYLKFLLGFIGVKEVEFINADQLLTVGPTQLEKAKAEVANIGVVAKAA